MPSAAAEVLRNELASLPPVRLAALFGSAARGQARPGSDLDVAILLEPNPAMTFAMVEVALARAARCAIDVVDLRTAPPLLRFEIARDGVALYERQAGLWADFRARAMIDWWDFSGVASTVRAVGVRRLREQVAGGEHGPS